MRFRADIHDNNVFTSILVLFFPVELALTYIRINSVACLSRRESMAEVEQR